MRRPDLKDADDEANDTKSRDNGKNARQRAEMAEEKQTFLPRLAKYSSKLECDSRAEGCDVTWSKQVKLPEIHVHRKEIAGFALHRSITDLLDPEMEILNKIKYGPKKKKRKRKDKNNVHVDLL